jgi:hypothetical protein
MTAHTVKSKIAFSCDDCPETLETDDEDFGCAWASARSLGWHARKNQQGKWEHECPDCAAEADRG